MPRDDMDHNEHKEAQDHSQEEVIGTLKKTEEGPVSEVDSAVHSGEEEPHNPPFWACPLCNKPLEDLAAAVVQHLKDHHTLPNPQPPTPSQAEPGPN